MKSTVLPNGLTIVVEEIPSMESATIGIVVGVGSRYEHESDQGISHFLEHMMFKGTHTRSHKDITRELEGIGGHLNAWTSTSQTFFYTKFVGNHTGKVVNILSDMLFNCKLDPKDIYSEKQVVCQELKMYEDDPSSQVDSLLDKMMYENTSLGHDIIGTIETINDFDSVGNVYDYWNTYYRLDNMTVVAVGNVSYKDVLKAIKDNWVGTSKKSKFRKLRKIRSFKNSRRITREYRKSNQSNIAIGIEAIGSLHKDYEAVNLLAVILGGNMSSRLWETVREKHGLAYSIRCMLDCTEDTGLLKISAGISPNKLDQCIHDIIFTIASTKDNVTKDELDRAKRYLIGNLKMHTETNSGRTNAIVKTLLDKDNLTLKQRFAKYNKVTLKDINRVYKKYIREENFGLAMLGPISPLTEQKLKDEWGF